MSSLQTQGETQKQQKLTGSVGGPSKLATQLLTSYVQIKPKAWEGTDPGELQELQGCDVSTNQNPFTCLLFSLSMSFLL